MAFIPIIMAAVSAAGVAMQMQATQQAGRDAKKIARQRAAIDMANAEQTRVSTVAEAKSRGEQGRRLLAMQKSQAAAGNIRINTGSPLVIETETQELIARDIGYVLETGRFESAMFESGAGLEMAQGRAIKKQSDASALAQGLQGYGSVAMTGRESGMFGRTSRTIPLTNQGVPRYYA